MKELYNTLLETSKERLKNPIIGGFILAWVLFNWKPLLYLINSESKIEEKIKFIDKNYVHLGVNLFYPLLISIGYILILPYCMLLLEFCLKFATKGRKKLLNDHKINEIDLQIERSKKEIQLEASKADHRDKEKQNGVINSLREELSQLETENSNLIKEIEVLMSEKDNLTKNITESSKFVFHDYEEFKKTDMYTHLESVGAEIMSDNQFPAETNGNLRDKYILNNLIDEHVDEHTERSYYLFSEQGEEFYRTYLNSMDLTQS